jgi:hypothetical protein
MRSCRHRRSGPLPALRDALEGKKVAVFGLREQVTYAESYADATGAFERVGVRHAGMAHGGVRARGQQEPKEAPMGAGTPRSFDRSPNAPVDAALKSEGPRGEAATTPESRPTLPCENGVPRKPRDWGRRHRSPSDVARMYPPGRTRHKPGAVASCPMPPREAMNATRSGR